MERKRILFVIEAIGGGVFTYIVDLANELSMNYKVYVAYAVRPQTSANYKDCFESHIHLHSSEAGVLGRVIFDDKIIPIFYTFHPYSFLMKNHNMLKRMLYKVIDTICAKVDCTTVSSSKGEYEKTLKLTRKAEYINNGINVDELQKILDGVQRDKNKYTVFTLERICYRKNSILFNKIALTMPDEKFLCIRDGELRAEFTVPNIEITGWADRNKVLEFSTQGEVFVLPSLWEGLPISLLEVMYMKKLCVVNDVIGNRNVVVNNVNGYVFDSVEAFVYGIINGGTELIEKVYEDVLSEYNTKVMAVMAEKYSTIYKKMIGVYYLNSINLFATTAKAVAA